MSSIIHFLIQSNVPYPVSYYNSNFTPLKTAVRMSGYPHRTLEKTLSAVYRMAQEKKTSIQVIHHCLDNSIQGIILPEYSAGVIGFDIYDPDEMNILADFSPELISFIHSNLSAARETLIRARTIHDEQEKIYCAHMNFEEANRLTDETIHRLLDGKQADRRGADIHRFFGAATVDGSLDYIPEVTLDIPKRYLIKGRPGTGKSTFLKKIAAAAMEKGFDTEIYHCSLDPNSLDMVAVRALGFCLFDSTAPHEYFPSRPEDEIIDVYQRCVTPGTDEKYQTEIERLNASYKELVSSATRYLKDVKTAADEFESSLPDLDENTLKSVTDRVLSKLFND